MGDQSWYFRECLSPGLLGCAEYRRAVNAGQYIVTDRHTMPHIIRTKQRIYSRNGLLSGDLSNYIVQYVDSLHNARTLYNRELLIYIQQWTPKSTMDECYISLYTVELKIPIWHPRNTHFYSNKNKRFIVFCEEKKGKSTSWSHLKVRVYCAVRNFMKITIK